jgi:mycothiol synthase
VDQSIGDEYTLPALYLILRPQPSSSPHALRHPSDYALRAYQQNDEQLLGELLSTEGWTMSASDWQDYQDRIVPNGLFLLWNEPTNRLVGTAGAIHNPRGGRYYFPSGGQLAYLVVHPAYRGRGLGTLLIAHVIHRLQFAHYTNIWTGVQGFRLPAIKRYIDLGFLPLLHQPQLTERWQRIYNQLGRPFTPDQWPMGV